MSENIKVEILNTDNYFIVEITNAKRSMAMRSYGSPVDARKFAHELSEVLGCTWTERKV